MASEKAETCRSINNIITDNKLVVFLTSLHHTFTSFNTSNANMVFTNATNVYPVTPAFLKLSAQFYVHVRHLNSLLTVSLTLHIQHRAAAAWPVAMKL